MLPTTRIIAILTCMAAAIHAAPLPGQVESIERALSAVVARVEPATDFDSGPWKRADDGFGNGDWRRDTRGFQSGSFKREASAELVKDLSTSGEYKREEDTVEIRSVRVEEELDSRQFGSHGWKREEVDSRQFGQHDWKRDDDEEARAFYSGGWKREEIEDREFRSGGFRREEELEDRQYTPGGYKREQS